MRGAKTFNLIMCLISLSVHMLKMYAPLTRWVNSHWLKVLANLGAIRFWRTAPAVRFFIEENKYGKLLFVWRNR